MTITYIVNGQSLTRDQFEAQAQKPMKRPPVEREAFFRGFRVMGYPPGFIEEARAAVEPPKEFDLTVWMRKNKPRRIERQFELWDAAKTCKDLAEKAGWEHVEIQEMKREAA